MPISIMCYCIDVRTLRSWLLLHSFSAVLTDRDHLTYRAAKRNYNATKLCYGAYRVSRLKPENDLTS